MLQHDVRRRPQTRGGAQLASLQSRGNQGNCILRREQTIPLNTIFVLSVLSVLTHLAQRLLWRIALLPLLLAGTMIYHPTATTLLSPGY